MCTIARGVEFREIVILHQKMDNRTIEQKLGAAIMMRRRNQLISQEDFARKAGINRSYMSSIENGKRMVSVSVIERVAGALGITRATHPRGDAHLRQDNGWHDGTGVWRTHQGDAVGGHREGIFVSLRHRQLIIDN